MPPPPEGQVSRGGHRGAGRRWGHLWGPCRVASAKLPPWVWASIRGPSGPVSWVYRARAQKKCVRPWGLGRDLAPWESPLHSVGQEYWVHSASAPRLPCKGPPPAPGRGGRLQTGTSVGVGSWGERRRGRPPGLPVSPPLEGSRYLPPPPSWRGRGLPWSCPVCKGQTGSQPRVPASQLAAALGCPGCGRGL